VDAPRPNREAARASRCISARITMHERVWEPGGLPKGAGVRKHAPPETQSSLWETGTTTTGTRLFRSTAWVNEPTSSSKTIA
jgi:hypothetical protein